MFNAAEAFRRWATHPLGRAVGAAQGGVRLLQLHQFPVQAVVDRVFQNRAIEHVIGMGCSVEQASQLGSPFVLLRH